MWILIFKVLFIFAIGVGSVESEEIDVINCNSQIDNEIYLIDKCTDQIFNSTAFTNELEITLLQYAGDNNVVQAFANKYCPILNNVIQCRFAGNVSEECLRPYETEKVQRYSVFTAVLNYVCANNAAVLINVLENNGLDTVYDNSEFFQCLAFMLTASRNDDTNFGITFEICDGVDKTYECYADVVRDHKNQNLTIIANELRTVLRQTIKCQTANEL